MRFACQFVFRLKLPRRLSQLWLNGSRTAVGDASISPAAVLCVPVNKNMTDYLCTRQSGVV